MEPCLGTCSCNLACEPVSWKPVPAELAWKPCLTWHLFFGTLPKPVSRNLAWDSVLACRLACSCFSMFLGSCSGQHERPVLGNFAWEPVLGTVLENLACEPCLTTLPTIPFFKTLHARLCLKASLRDLALKPCLQPCLQLFFEILLGNLFWGSCSLEREQPVLANLFLGNLAWEPVVWEPCLRTSSWEPCLGTCFWEPFKRCSLEPGTLAQCGFGYSDLLRDLYYGRNIPWYVSQIYLNIRWRFPKMGVPPNHLFYMFKTFQWDSSL